MGTIKEYIGQLPQVQKVFNNMDQATTQLITGLSGSARTVFMASLMEEKGKQIVVVTQNLFHANQLVEDLIGLLPEEKVKLFPVDEMIHAEMAFASPEARAERVETLNFIINNQAGIVVIPVAGLRKILPPKNLFEDAQLKIKLGGEIEPHDLLTHLVEMGYTREQIVASPGEFSVRGGIIDIYPLTEENPVRVELFDTEVDSLRFFDAEKQRSIRNIEEITIVPASEQIYSPSLLKNAAISLEKSVTKELKKIKTDEEKKLLSQYMDEMIRSMHEGEMHDDLGLFVDFIYPKYSSIVDYLNEDSIILIDEYPRIIDTNRRLEEEESEWVASRLQDRRILSSQTFSNDFRAEIKKVNQNLIYFAIFQKGMGNLRFDSIHPFQFRAMQQFFGQMHLFKTEMDRWRKQKYTVIVMTVDDERAEKVQQTLKDFEMEARLSKNGNIKEGEIQVIPSTIQTGFELPEEKLAVLTEKELFNRVKKKKVRRTNLSNAERLKSYSELKAGDFVVHIHHGIGRYTGMETLEVDGVHQDYLSIAYKNDSKLFIPVTQLDLLQKYVASEGKKPRINKLGGTEWAKTKRKVESRVEDIADELIELYAIREQEVGYGFSKDNGYQQEFEEAFPYRETEDQLRSIEEVKRDMEKPKPMDRLIVGDVGYGKTEVAMRAAFKAIQDQKQVAFLVPTTVLAQQHYETMLERFQDFPVGIGLLSRFRTRKQQTETIKGIEKGYVDIVVGTHRVLSKDVKFQDLGLLIVDEEQRFGVKHKERLKQIKKEVDVLTLTATPIPRTLHMSMLGVRDLSVIETPPANRYPVQTYVMEMNAGAIREAIEREIARNGQVFYLYNRVATIEKRVDELQQLVPEARIAYAHGQMSEGQLENVLFEFVQGEYDILVTTTIIETGVDMPNVNTLLVENADYMGLSQLYQLRGRVGRSNRVAYAYFMYQTSKVLTEVSEKRLQAIKDFTELGSGFKIAMRDLSIRGAGNLLGKQQHGFIDSVGFDLYSQMLSEAVARKKGDKPKEKTTVEIDLGLDAYIPGNYIEDERQKIEIYKRIRQFSAEEEYWEIQEDLVDRFGDYPQEVTDLLNVGLLKMYSEQALIETIKRTERSLFVKFSEVGTSQLPLQEVFKAMQDIPLKVDMNTDNKQLSVIFKIRPQMESASWMDYLLIFSKNISQFQVDKEMGSKE